MQRKAMFSAVTLMPMAWKICEGNTLTEGPVEVMIEALNINALPCLFFFFFFYQSLSFLAKSCYTFNPNTFLYSSQVFSVKVPGKTKELSL